MIKVRGYYTLLTNLIYYGFLYSYIRIYYLKWTLRLSYITCESEFVNFDDIFTVTLLPYLKSICFGNLLGIGFYLKIYFYGSFTYFLRCNTLNFYVILDSAYLIFWCVPHANTFFYYFIFLR
jgi:hypothetical protein